MNFKELIITAASEAYTAQLLSFLGSLRCNWPSAPPVLVYDLGLSDATLIQLSELGYNVRKIPPFVPHWRKHYAWKLWCMHDAPAERVLWLDSGCCILRPVPEIFAVIATQGYFALPNYRPLNLEASEEACEGCGVLPSFRDGKVVATGAVVGFLRGSVGERVIEESYTVAQTERFIKATKPEHRHDQAILSLNFYKLISPLVLCDAGTYFNEDLKARFCTHSIWAARRNMNFRDRKHFANSLTGDARPYVPGPSHKLTLWYRTAWNMKVFLDNAKTFFSSPEKIPDGVK